MRITALYRAHPGTSTKPRPTFFDKTLAFQSFLSAWREVEDRRLVVFYDASALDGPLADMVGGSADQVIVLGGVGNSASYRRCLDFACRLPADELVYFAEDDYLYVPEAFSALDAAVPELPDVDYFTLYDHPDRYTRHDDALVVTRWPVRLAGGRHWRRTESTTMTFAARVGALQGDARIHRRYTRGEQPRDRSIWRVSQGLGRNVLRRRRRRLVSPIPSLATHLEEEFLAPKIDWRAVAAEVPRSI